MKKEWTGYGGILALVVFLLALFPARGTADTAGVQSFTNPIVWPNNDNEDFSLGFEFSVTGSATVLDLGYNYFSVPLNESHQVGIYDSTGTLLGSVTVTNSSTVDNGYLYTALSTPLTLSAGDYWIAGTTLGLNDGWIYQASNIVTAPGISYVDSWFTNGNGGMLSFPTTDTGGARQYLPVNFLLSSASVPEPSSIMLMATAVAGLALLVRHRLA